jgi:lysyl-tRNA synthetase class 2
MSQICFPPSRSLPNILYPGIDHSHNPEFTSCELYQAYGTFESLITLTEDLVYGLACLVANDGHLSLPGGSDGPAPTVDCRPPYRRVNLVNELELQTGEALHSLLSAANAGGPAEEAALVEQLLSLCRTHGLADTQPHTSAALLDRLCGHFIEPQCRDPTFITHHPLCMSPLAKADAERVWWGEKKEVAKFIYAFTELKIHLCVPAPPLLQI